MIDLQELARRVQGQVAGVEVKPNFFDGELIFVTLSTSRYCEAHFYDGVGEPHITCSIVSDEDRQLIRFFLNELDREQSTPTDQPAEGAGG